mmetsp:Transcript_15592/g.59180  ORF Transcript_15592/g.59180 Transcript_15592/m.59180 type:complete len:364 (-) Transcript_15592:324-1415(-)
MRTTSLCHRSTSTLESMSAPESHAVSTWSMILVWRAPLACGMVQPLRPMLSMAADVPGQSQWPKVSAMVARRVTQCVIEAQFSIMAAPICPKYCCGPSDASSPSSMRNLRMATRITAASPRPSSAKTAAEMKWSFAKAACMAVAGPTTQGRPLSSTKLEETPQHRVKTARYMAKMRRRCITKGSAMVTHFRCRSVSSCGMASTSRWPRSSVTSTTVRLGARRIERRAGLVRGEAFGMDTVGTARRRRLALRLWSTLSAEPSEGRRSFPAAPSEAEPYPGSDGGGDSACAGWLRVDKLAVASPSSAGFASGSELALHKAAPMPPSSRPLSSSPSSSPDCPGLGPSPPEGEPAAASSIRPQQQQQ